MCIQTFEIVWNGITILIKHTPNDFDEVSHIEIQSVDPSNAPLPITETGYRSHFYFTETKEQEITNVVGFVKDWIETEAASKSWKDFDEAQRQGTLF